jgi:hypothetical protein
VCDQCKAILDRYNAATRNLSASIADLRAARGTPDFQTLRNRAESTRREVLIIKSEMDRHQHEHHSLT